MKPGRAGSTSALSRTHPLVQTFPVLEDAPCRHAFITRIPDIDVSRDKAEALQRLETSHTEIRREIGLSESGVCRLRARALQRVRIACAA